MAIDSNEIRAARHDAREKQRHEETQALREFAGRVRSKLRYADSIRKVYGATELVLRLQAECGCTPEDSPEACRQWLDYVRRSMP